MNNDSRTKLPSVKDAAPTTEVDGLESILDRDALTAVCRSFFDLFGISVRVFSKSGGLVADVHQEQAICKYVNGLAKGKLACATTVNEVRSVEAREGTVMHPCFTGAVYRIVPIEYQGQRVGRFVLGPYLPRELAAPPRSLFVIDSRIDGNLATEHWGTMPSMGIETAERIAKHFQGVLDLILFAGHRAQLTTQMHLASIRESYRELVDKTGQLQKAYDKLKELDQLKSAFLATVSHELRTPLTSILGYSEMLATDLAGPMNDEQKEFVSTIRQKGEHLLALITNILDIGKLEQSRIELRRELVDPSVLLTELASTVGPLAAKKKVKLEFVRGKSLPPFSADPVRVRQVLLNLADNAIKFTPEGGQVTVTVEVTSREGTPQGELGLVLMAAPLRMVEFTVRDTGIGISSASQTRVFDAFYQVDGSSTREHGGVGLGLSIVKRIVDAHEGDIRIESAQGKGTAFFIDFPEQPSIATQ